MPTKPQRQHFARCFAYYAFFFFLLHKAWCFFVLQDESKEDEKKDKEKEGEKKAEEKKPEPNFEILSNPARVMNQQVPKLYSVYFGIFNVYS